MQKTPKISIVIPIYNVEAYLSKCLESVINQTLIDIEIICVDDGTKDRSCEIVEEYQQHDDRIILVHKQNGGLSSARNAGMRVAQGSYICFLDSDDYIEKTACERLYVETLEGRPDIITFGAHAFPAFPAPDRWLINTLSPRSITYTHNCTEALFGERGAYPFVWRQCFRQGFLKDNRLEFDENVKFGEDLVFQFNAFPCAETAVFISDKLYFYRWYRENSLMHSASQKLYEKYDQHIKLVDIIANAWVKNGVIEKYKNSLFDWSIGFMGYDLKEFADIEAKKVLVHKLFYIWKKYDFLIKSTGLTNKGLLRYLERINRC
ncbi:hypothetical protein F220043C3_04930 [Enterocloster asparagiformis]|uniref:glycosyltransferase family 2 protein n=1 Tax=Enterocloster asparagiformis TaxID=333367 RepID=UPI0034B973EA